jgi:hypothetical protein
MVTLFMLALLSQYEAPGAHQVGDVMVLNCDREHRWPSLGLATSASLNSSTHPTSTTIRPGNLSSARLRANLLLRLLTRM